jgi:hypothetical protein
LDGGWLTGSFFPTTRHLGLRTPQFLLACTFGKEVGWNGANEASLFAADGRDFVDGSDNRLGAEEGGETEDGVEVGTAKLLTQVNAF